MLKLHLPLLFDNDPNLRSRADTLAERTFELVSFLSDVMGVESCPPAMLAARSPTTIAAQACASWASRNSHASCCNAIGATDQRDAGCGGLLWLWRHVLRQVSRHLCPDGVRQGSQYRLNRCGDRDGRRSGVSAEYCRAAAAGRPSMSQARHVAELLAGMTKDVQAIGEPSQ